MKDFSASIDQSEIEKFSKIADEWWDPNGKFKPLHQINPVRIKYILQNIEKFLISESKSFKDLKILDIGCGGGLLSESFSRLGFQVTAIDASSKNIEIAKLHSKEMSLEIDYRNISVEILEESQEKWDVILNMEVIEHVADIDSFMKSSISLLKPGGIMYISTINKNIKAYLLAIIAAEYILGWLPRGTHNYNKFLTPSELNKLLRKNNLNLCEVKGMSYNIFKNSWFMTDNIDVNYIMTARK